MKIVSSAQMVLPEMPSGVLPIEGLQFHDVPLLQDIKIDISKINWVRSRESLAALAERLNCVSSFAIDTETGAQIDPATGLPDPSEEISAHLSLIQIALSEAEIYIVDVPALSSAGQIDDWSALEALRAPLSNPAIEKVMHFCAFEREQFLRYGIELDGVYDTFTAARKFRADMPTHTLAACLWEICGVRMSKEAQSAPWMTRPLRDDWIEYAARDPLATLILRQSFRPLEDRLASARCSNPAESLKVIPEVYMQALDEIRPIAVDYFLLDLRARNLRDAIKHRLLDATKRALDPTAFDATTDRLFEQPGDNAYAERSREYRIDFEKLLLLHPRAYAELVKWRISIDSLRHHLVSAPLLKASYEVEKVFRAVVVDRESVRVGEFLPAYRARYRYPELSERGELCHYFGEHVSTAAKLYRELRDYMSELRPDLKPSGVAACVIEMGAGQQLLDPSDQGECRANFDLLYQCHSSAVKRFSEAQVDFKAWSVAQMCDALLDLKRQQLDMMRSNDTGQRYWLLRALGEQHRLDATDALISMAKEQGAVSVHDESGGVLSVAPGLERCVSIELLQLHYPEYYEALAKRRVSRDELREYLLSHQLTRQECEIVSTALLEPLHSDRKWRVRIKPDYASLYKFRD